MPAAATLLQAVVAWFHADATLATLMTVGALGSPWFAEMPEEKALPFVALEHGGARPDWTFENGYEEVYSITFTAFALGMASVEAIGMAIQAAFNPLIDRPHLMDVTNSRVISFLRTDYVVKGEPARNENGDQVFRATLPYEVRLKRTY